MTAPMKFDRSVTSPIVMPSTSAANSSLKPEFQIEAGMYAREVAEHFWPWYSKAPRVSAVFSTARSALGWATTKSLPPVSPTSRGYVRYFVDVVADRLPQVTGRSWSSR